jgi:hypothetical protein
VVESISAAGSVAPPPPPPEPTPAAPEIAITPAVEAAEGEKK